MSDNFSAVSENGGPVHSQYIHAWCQAKNIVIGCDMQTPTDEH